MTVATRNLNDAIHYPAIIIIHSAEGIVLMEKFISEKSAYELYEVGLIGFFEEKKLKFYKIENENAPIRKKDIFLEIDFKQITKVCFLASH